MIWNFSPAGVHGAQREPEASLGCRVIFSVGICRVGDESESEVTSFSRVILAILC